MTANVLPEQISRFRQAGMNDHVGKPFRPKELLEVVERWLPDLVLSPEAPPARAVEGVIDRRTYDELVELIGEQRVHALLGRLEKLLAVEEDANRVFDIAGVAAEAHTLVSVAGMLGFNDLSDACRSLEQACLTGQEVDNLFARTRDLRGRALESIA